MLARKIRENIYWMGSVDWDSRLFDALIPLPDGTSYNAYFVEGSEKSVLIDTVVIRWSDDDRRMDWTGISLPDEHLCFPAT